MQWVLRAVVAYLFLLLVVKVMGRRSISQLNILDFAISLVIGNVIAHPLSDEGLGLTGAMITMGVLVLLYSGSVLLVLKSPRARVLVTPDPMPLVRRGQLVYPNMKKARITIDYLLSEARKAKIEDIQKLSLALWEPDGTISFFESPQYQGPTRNDFDLPSQPFNLPKVVIREGRADHRALEEAGLDEAWLLQALKTEHYIGQKDVLLATLDESRRLNVFIYGR
ncbi:DUF421 domain-containing protein [Edaphobacillus lindanitolerans]|uniref:Uncharacterized membrane protein YcaP, DUF421 family n=1 Tax=Edaphobacillus lindanitolerans TaxID=550447 RepID=A0A1U7PNC7_9BACI|nr:DUF421 domain-containing protein [Edaphobacillus lindanitolerans]SIT72280.1 Uncharacterized membrane protein YcaP, DUF421 family [Edaphobacillus lindanitolerans]